MSAMIEIVQSKKQLKEFLSVPDHIQKSEKNYISPIKLMVRNALDKKKNPFWKQADFQLYILKQNGKAVGRIAAIYPHQHSEIHTEKVGYFGYFECINDVRKAKQLLDAALQYLEQFGLRKLIGPLNPSVNYELGVLTAGFEVPAFFMMNYNPPYYKTLMEQCGGVPDMKFAAFTQRCGAMPAKIQNHSDLLKSKYHIKIEEIDYTNYDASALELCEIYNDAFQDHWGFLPFTPEEFIQLARDLKMILNRKLLFKLTWEGKPAAFILAIPNLNEAIRHLDRGRLTPWGLFKFLRAKSNIQWVKVMVVAVKKQYQAFGLGAVLYTEMAKRVEENGYLGGEISWVADNNHTMNKMVSLMGAEKVKEYAVYGFVVK